MSNGQLELGLPARPRNPPDFAWREGNRFALLKNGKTFLPRMLEAIREARTLVWLEMYLFESGAIGQRFINALCEAAKRGVQVKVMIDALGSRGLEERDRKRLLAAGVSLRIFNPLRWSRTVLNLIRDHRKLLIVDGKSTFVGGTGLTDSFGPDARHYWRETMVEINGPVVQDWQTLFLSLWQDKDDEKAVLPDCPVSHFRPGMHGRVVPTHRTPALAIQSNLVKRIRRAEHRVWLTSAYFLPSWKVRRALVQTARRGVDVCLLLPGSKTDHPSVRYMARALYGHMLRNGVRIFEYQPRFLHMKVLLVDDWVSIGSSNLDHWGFFWNLEANQEILDPEFAEATAAMLAKDFVDAVLINADEWLHRNLWQRWPEVLWGKVWRVGQQWFTRTKRSEEED